MHEPELVNLGRAVIDRQGIIAIFKNRDSQAFVYRLLRRVGIVKQEYKLFVDYANKSEIGKTFNGSRATITWDTREERDAAYDKLVRSLTPSAPASDETSATQV